METAELGPMEEAFLLRACGYNLDFGVLGVLWAVRCDPVHDDRVVHDPHAKGWEPGQWEEWEVREEERA